MPAKQVVHGATYGTLAGITLSIFGTGFLIINFFPINLQGLSNIYIEVFSVFTSALFIGSLFKVGSVGNFWGGFFAALSSVSTIGNIVFVNLPNAVQSLQSILGKIGIH